jgi:hypothetical protein
LDGARIEVKKGRATWNATLLRLVLVKPGVFDNVPDHPQTFWGTGFVAPKPFWKVSNIRVWGEKSGTPLVCMHGKALGPGGIMTTKVSSSGDHSVARPFMGAR